ncbi:MAG TPA: ATP-binding protein [Candidatus Saccharimonadales bacterium]
MDILNKPITSMSFADIVDFCKLKVIEGVSLEYKQDFPKDLAKQFVTFSNTQGGLIIIGISEDPKTGLPEKWDGIDATTKPIDRVYQIAANVIPFPSFEVTTTDEVGGKVFVLIRVREGMAPPYVTNSDPTPWVRTGNISTPIGAANRDELLQLMTKREQAQHAREAAIDFTRQNFDIDIADAEKERQAMVSKPGQTENIYKHPLGISDLAAIFDVSVMPFYPSQNLLQYGDLSQMNTLLGSEWQNTAFIHRNKSIPGGIKAFHWQNWSGVIVANQIFFNGHSYMAADVLQTHENRRTVSAYLIAEYLHKELEIAKTVFVHAGYNGQVSVHASLRGGKGAITTPPDDRFWNDSRGELRFGEYKWVEDTDTASMLDKGQLAEVHLKLLKRICWDIGLGEVANSLISGFFEARGWYK